MTKYYAFWSHLALICLSTKGGKIFIFKTSFISWWKKAHRTITMSTIWECDNVSFRCSSSFRRFFSSMFRFLMAMLHDNAPWQCDTKATPKRIKKVRTKKEASKTTISISPRQAMNMWQRHRALSGLQDMHSPLTVLSKNLHNKINSLTWKWF